MASDVRIMGLVGRTSRTSVNAANDQANIIQSDGQELVAAMGLPSEAELTRLGMGWGIIGTAVTAVAAIPTTAAHLTLYNPGPNVLLISQIAATCTTTVAAASCFTLFARNDVPYQNANPAGALIISGTSGKPYSGAANAKASVTLAAIGAANNVAWWAQCGSSTPNTTTVGLSAILECYGRFIVRPGGAFSLATVAQTAAGAWAPQIMFYEVPMITG